MRNGIHLSKSDIKFVSDVEKIIHRKISAMRYGEFISLSMLEPGFEDKTVVAKAIKKSARYNCMELRVTWAKDNSLVNIQAEYV